MNRLLLVLFGAATAALVVSCSPPVEYPDSSVRRDTGPRDGRQPLCLVDEDCADGVYCNGRERCTPGAAGVDSFGCVAASPASACLASQACVEGIARCLTQCTQTADADGDGHRAAECGGDDCDDADRNRFPGNPETCDSFHDEDCDLATLGTLDADGDGIGSATCCNSVPGVPKICAADCDDSTRAVNPQAAEVCDGVDNNCNGVIDEGQATQTFYPDCDGDQYGAVGSTGVPGCAPPAGAPTCSLPTPGSTWAPNNRDCDDADDGRHPGGLELCDNFDNNCDGRIDESPAASRSCGAGANAIVQCTAGHCAVMTCTTGFGDCDGSASNGCETDLSSSVGHCGACGRSCIDPSSPGIGRACVASGCVDVPCPGGYHYCNGACQSVTSITACGFGSTCIACPVPTNGAATCSGMSCDITCNTGFSPYTGARCIPSPRLIGPTSGAVVHTRLPWLTVDAPFGTTGQPYGVEYFRDRGRTMPLGTDSFTSTPMPSPVQATVTLPLGVVYWRAYVGTGASRVETEVWEIVVASGGSATPAHAGTIMDLNGDGLVDLAAAAPSAMSGAGRADVFDGNATGLSATASTSLSAPMGVTGFASAVANAGDMNGDGFGDLVVASETAMSEAGRAYVYFGSGTGVATTPSMTLAGFDGVGAHFGATVVGGFDANADGYADIAISAPRAVGSVNVYVFYGGPNGGSTTPGDVLSIGPGGVTDGFGAAIGAGDFNGDGRDDIAVGAPMSSSGTGAVYLFFAAPARIGFGGPAFASPSPFTLTDPAGVPGNRFGASVAMNGDFGMTGADGFDDLAVGAPGAGGGLGRVLIFGGTSSAPQPPQQTTDGTAAMGLLGSAATFIGDVNGDASDDLAFANPAVNGGVGSVTLITGFGSPLITVSGLDGAGGSFGASVPFAGDIDHDTFSDLVVGAEGVTMSSGRVYVFSGGLTGVRTTPTLMLNGAAGDRFGHRVATRVTPARRARSL